MKITTMSNQAVLDGPSGITAPSGSPLFMLGEINVIKSPWDLFWMPGAPDMNIEREWWFGMGYTWWNAFAYPFLGYAIIRGIWIIRRLTIGSGGVIDSPLPHH
jgi:hypothetical protein